jgi:hypothetical protein
MAMIQEVGTRLGVHSVEQTQFLENWFITGSLNQHVAIDTTTRDDNELPSFLDVM